MKNIIRKHRFLASFLSIIVSVFLVAAFTYAATTIGTNITTGGTLAVTGTATFESASTTNDFWLGNVIADDDDYLYMDASSSEYMMWDDDPGQFAFSNDLKVTGVTTSTLAFWAGSAGTVDIIDMTGGDLYVQNDAEIDNNLYVTNKATSTVAFAVGSGTIDNLDMTGGDLYVLDDAEIDGDVTVAGEITSTGSTTASVINMTTVKFTPSATPTSAVTGECFIDSTDNQLNCYDGANWQHAW